MSVSGQVSCGGQPGCAAHLADWPTVIVCRDKRSFNVLRTTLCLSSPVQISADYDAIPMPFSRDR
ncbi:hypothetical protein J6590_002500 [Homalodisca vitripennis]|nr:hypothetical protein J6590_002500 [Homalodisca vitripennis]